MRPDLAAVLDIEPRWNRAYDEQTPSHLFLPNSSLLASYDRQFLNVAAREVLNLWTAEAETNHREEDAPGSFMSASDRGIEDEPPVGITPDSVVNGVGEQ